jgi:hypothetical protein
MSLRRKSVPIFGCLALVTVTLCNAVEYAESATSMVASELAEKTNTLLKDVFEEQFGPLEADVYEEKQIFGTVVGLDYKLKDGKLRNSHPSQLQNASLPKFQRRIPQQVVDSQQLREGSRLRVLDLGAKNRVAQTGVASVEKLFQQCLVEHMGGVVQAEPTRRKGRDHSLVFRLQ